MRSLFLLALLAILHFSLYPWLFEPLPLSLPPWRGIGSNSDLTDLALNLAFYILPALLGQWAFPRSRSLNLLLLPAGLTLLSLSVEVLQFALPSRYPNLRDVFCNSIGAFSGALLGLRLPAPSLPRLPPLLSLWLLAFATWTTLPFIPYLRLHRLLQIPADLLHPSWHPAPMLDLFLVLTVLALLLRHLHLPNLLLTLAAALIPAQAFLKDFAFSTSLTLTAALALLAAATLFRHPTPRLYLSLALTLTLWILLRPPTPDPTSLRPLAGTFLLTTSALWLWLRAGLRLPTATLSLLLPTALAALAGRPSLATLLLTTLAAALLKLDPLTTKGGPVGHPLATSETAHLPQP